jgi:hypothetical protein
LFQITLVPDAVMRTAALRLGVDKPLVADHRHNGFIAAATLHYYLNQMKTTSSSACWPTTSAPKTAACALSCSNTAPPIL